MAGRFAQMDRACQPKTPMTCELANAPVLVTIHNIPVKPEATSIAVGINAIRQPRRRQGKPTLPRAPQQWLEQSLWP